MANQPNIKKVEIPINKTKIPVSPNNTFPVRYRISSEDGSKISAWSNIYEVAGPEVIGGDAMTLKLKGNKVNMAWEDDNNRVLYDVFMHRFSDIDLSDNRSVIKSRPSSTTAQMVLYDNKSTQTDSRRQEHHLKVGMRIALTNFAADFTIADTYVIAVPDPYTFIYSPVPTTTTPAGGSDSTGQIVILSTTPDIIANIEEYDFKFVGRTDKNTFSVNKGTVTSLSASGASNTYTTTDVWCLVQNATSDQKPNDLVDIATGHLAV